VRAVVPWLVLAAATVLTHVAWLPFACLALGVLSVPLALDRYRSLGHGWDGERVSVREGSLRRRQFVVERPGIVGWRMRQSWFQRRINLVTLDVAVGAGRGAYAAVDVDRAEAVRFAADVTPAWIGPLLEDPVRGRVEDHA
jgi:putative membrane protein